MRKRKFTFSRKQNFESPVIETEQESTEEESRIFRKKFAQRIKEKGFKRIHDM